MATEKAVECYDAAIDYTKSREDKQLVSVLHRNYGLRLRDLGEIQEAHDVFSAAQRFSAEIGDDRGLSLTEISLIDLSLSREETMETIGMLLLLPILKISLENPAPVIIISAPASIEA